MIQEVKESLKAPLIELQEIEMVIYHLCELVEAMKIKRKAIQKRIDDHNIILSPESPVLLTGICSS